MKRYMLSASVTVSAYTYVVANSEEEAIKIGEERSDVHLGGTQSGYDADESWVIEDADGTPMNIRVDK